MLIFFLRAARLKPVFFSALAAGFRGGSFEYAYARINRAIRYDLFSGLIKQEVAFFDAHKTGIV